MCYLIGVGPEGRNGQLSLHPAFSDSIRGVPDRVTLSASIHLQADSDKRQKIRRRKLEGEKKNMTSAGFMRKKWTIL